MAGCTAEEKADVVAAACPGGGAIEGETVSGPASSDKETEQGKDTSGHSTTIETNRVSVQGKDYKKVEWTAKDTMTYIAFVSLMMAFGPVSMVICAALGNRWLDNKKEEIEESKKGDFFNESVREKVEDRFNQAKTTADERVKDYNVKIEELKAEIKDLEAKNEGASAEQIEANLTIIEANTKEIEVKQEYINYVTSHEEQLTKALEEIKDAGTGTHMPSIETYGMINTLSPGILNDMGKELTPAILHAADMAISMDLKNETASITEQLGTIEGMPEINIENMVYADMAIAIGEFAEGMKGLDLSSLNELLVERGIDANTVLSAVDFSAWAEEGTISPEAAAEAIEMQQEYNTNFATAIDTISENISHHQHSDKGTDDAKDTEKDNDKNNDDDVTDSNGAGVVSNDPANPTSTL